jgi:hypothetical protein
MGTVANIKVQPMEVTWAGSAMGFTDGDIELAIEEQVVDVTAHQEGTNVLSGIRTGKSAEISLTIKETNPAMVQYLFQQGGLYDTASGGSVDVIGWGSNKDFTQVLSQAGKLVLHPVVNAANNLAEDIAAWKAYPMLETFSFSAENPSTIQLTFKIYPDMAKADGFRLFVIGDSTTGDFSAVAT